MTKIYTKTGDNGRTTLYGGSKVKKCSNRVHAYGAVDEANTLIGLAAAQIENEDLETLLRICQQKLFLIGSELASDDRGRRTPDRCIFRKTACIKRISNSGEDGEISLSACRKSYGEKS